MSDRRTFVLVDGENIDATLGGSVLGRRPHPEERPRWERVTAHVEEAWGQPVTGLFFLNASNGNLPTSFVQALLAMDYRPVPLSGRADEKVVDIGIQRTLTALLEREDTDVVLASHDADFAPQLESLLGDRPTRRADRLPRVHQQPPRRPRPRAVRPRVRRARLQRRAAPGADHPARRLRPDLLPALTPPAPGRPTLPSPPISLQGA